ncbi:hypothetical protein LTSEALA_2694 [Salmonella enterica subsp. enterica serovar Alachua str. R6-377]|uniref:Uncharacterized protein n=1 Tax=Salmonella enterica subsp. enterica serovar Alachua str. R6-377 TaxID=913241 RepID=G5LPN1_SALET|nr:hypothetical protein LTSEALA_2694 [Salmonella enterica subsp. enterica serovar Alachua str. R6-377]
MLMQPGDAFRLVIDKHMEIFAIEELLLINRFDFRCVNL